MNPSKKQNEKINEGRTYNTRFQERQREGNNFNRSKIENQRVKVWQKTRFDTETEKMD